MSSFLREGFTLFCLPRSGQSAGHLQGGQEGQGEPLPLAEGALQPTSQSGLRHLDASRDESVRGRGVGLWGSNFCGQHPFGWTSTQGGSLGHTPSVPATQVGNEPQGGSSGRQEVQRRLADPEPVERGGVLHTDTPFPLASTTGKKWRKFRLGLQ